MLDYISNVPQGGRPWVFRNIKLTCRTLQSTYSALAGWLGRSVIFSANGQLFDVINDWLAGCPGMAVWFPHACEKVWSIGRKLPGLVDVMHFFLHLLSVGSWRDVRRPAAVSSFINSWSPFTWGYGSDEFGCMLCQLKLKVPLYHELFNLCYMSNPGFRHVSCCYRALSVLKLSWVKTEQEELRKWSYGRFDFRAKKELANIFFEKQWINPKSKEVSRPCRLWQDSFFYAVDRNV